MSWLIVLFIFSSLLLTAFCTWLGWCLGRARERRALFNELRSDIDRIKHDWTVGKLKFAHCRSTAAGLVTVAELMRDLKKRLAHAYRCSSDDPHEMSFRVRDAASKDAAAHCLAKFLVDEHDPLICRVSDAAQMVQDAAVALRNAVERRLKALAESGRPLDVKATRIARLKIALEAQASMPRQQPVNALKNLAAQCGVMAEILNQAENMGETEPPKSA